MSDTEQLRAQLQALREAAIAFVVIAVDAAPHLTHASTLAHLRSACNACRPDGALLMGPGWPYVIYRRDQ